VFSFDFHVATLRYFSDFQGVVLATAAQAYLNQFPVSAFPQRLRQSLRGTGTSLSWRPLVSVHCLAQGQGRGLLEGQPSRLAPARLNFLISTKYLRGVSRRGRGGSRRGRGGSRRGLGGSRRGRGGSRRCRGGSLRGRAFSRRVRGGSRRGREGSAAAA
jgi:hypothetical protein